MTEERLREEAERLGYVVHEQNKLLFTEEDVESRIQEALKKEQQKQQTKKQAVYAFTIGSGTDVKTVAYLLYEIGLIDDMNEFMNEIKSRKLTNRIQARYYIFEEKPDMERLITELTTPG
jgi:cell division protein YceG involved in septum cleavage